MLDMGKMTALEYEGEAGFFHQRLILRTASIAAMLNTTGRMCDSPNGLFWILTPDGDVYPELLRVPPATSVIRLNERNELIATTMMPAGRRFEQVYEFGAYRSTLLFPEVIVRAVLGAQEPEDMWREGEGPGPPGPLPQQRRIDTPRGRKVDEGDSLDPRDNMADPLLDMWVLSVRRNSAGDRHREVRDAVSELVQISFAGWPVPGPRTFLWCCKFMSEHCLQFLAHHSRFVQLSGLLPTDPSAQEHELLCRAVELGLTFNQLQGAELSCFFELLARRLQMLKMNLRDKVAGSLFWSSIEDSRIYLGTGQTRGLHMIAPELEEFASGVLAKETAAVKGSGAPLPTSKKK